MSLVGNLEDLSLGDLLQIVSLSQKSGVLSLESSSGAGQIVFRSGLVHAAGVKGETKDLRGLLAEAGLLEDSRYDAIVAGIGQRTSDLPLRIAAEAGLEGDQIDALIRKSAEGAIFTMFGWATGEFSFDALREGESPEVYASLQHGLNAQYLAMEGMRLRDEASRAPSGAAPDPEIELSDEVFFGSDALEMDAEADLDLGGDLGSASRPSAPASPAAVPAPAAVVPAAAPASVPTVVDEVASQAARSAVVDVARARAAAPIVEEVCAAQAAPAAGPDAPQLARPVVVIEPDAVALEWLKAGVDGRFARVHVFQRAEQGLARIRQYLIRGDVPVVLIALTAPIDPLSGIHGLPDFVKRLRTQAPRIVVVGLREQGESKADSVPAYLDGVLTRPARQQLRGSSPEETAVRPAELARRLAEIVTKKSGDGAGDEDGAAADVDGAAPPSPGDDAAEGLASARSQNEVFAVLLDAAALLYARTAILLLRDQEVFAVAGRGIEALAVDPLSAAPRLSCLVPATGLLHRVVRDRLPVAGSVRSDADRMVAGLFGAIAPKVAYLAPIPIPGGGLAVLYADQGATRRSQPDHTALEALIAQAAGVLERIAIHRVEGEARGREA
ncbi:MAG: DUF4388 domain-containing protein [Myxococcota bacterium]